MQHVRATPQDLRNFRKKHAVTQAQLAHDLGVTRSTVSRWERARVRIPSIMPVTLRGLTHIYASRRSTRRAYERKALIREQDHTRKRNETLEQMPRRIRDLINQT